MKKTLLTLVALLLAVAMCFAFVGCSKDDDKDDKKDDDKKTSVSDKADKDTDTDKEPVEDEEDEPVVENNADTEAIVEDYIDAVYKYYDAEKVFANVHEDVIKISAEESGMTEDDIYTTMQESLDAIKEMGVEIEHNIVGTVDVEDADTIIETYADAYGLEVEDVMAYEVEFSAEFAGEVSETTLTVTLVQIDGEWYLDTENSVI